MRFGDRPCDGEAKPRMVAEILFGGAIRMEPLENLFALLFRDAGALIADGQRNPVVAARDFGLDAACGRREGRVVCLSRTLSEFK